MVFYYTSANVRMLKNIILDYENTTEITPYEYMKTYIDKCPQDIVDSKLSWIAETFLGIKKHSEFLKGIASHLTEELSEEGTEFFMIIFYGVTFQIQIRDLKLLYKCLFNLNKGLLDTFTKFLSNNEVLTFISQIAQASYDSSYITEKIVGPLFEWQPYISEMAHSYAEYVKKVESRKTKPPTIPIQPNVLNRKGKDKDLSPPTAQVTLPPVTPPNSLRIKTKMLTKSAIDRRLQNVHEKNKHRANHLLNTVRNHDSHYARTYPKRRSDDECYKYENEFLHKSYTRQKPKVCLKVPPILVKETKATIKRLNKHIQKTEQNEIKWLENILFDFRDTTKIEELINNDRQMTEKERLLDIEKKHLIGQISHEEAVIAKKKVQDENRKKYEEHLRQKEIWNEEIENWKKMELEKYHKIIELRSLSELSAREAKQLRFLKKKEKALSIRKESEDIIAQILKVRQEEMEKKIMMIKEIKLLGDVIKKARAPRILDLTETSGCGFLCEMSIAELQEKLVAMKMGLTEELEKKKAMISKKNEDEKQNIEEVKKSIKDFINDRANIKKNNHKTNNNVEVPFSKDIDELKKVLEQKRKLRCKLTT